MIQVHKEQAKLVNAQSHLYGSIRPNMRVTKHNNADQNLLDFLLFMCFWIFGTKQVRIDQKEQTFNAFEKKKKKKKTKKKIVKKAKHVTIKVVCALLK